MLFLPVFLLSIVIVYPVWDYFYMKKIKNSFIPKWRIYGEIIGFQWLLVAILLTYWLISQRPVSDLFFTNNSLLSIQKGNILDIGVGIGVGVGVSFVMLTLIVYFSKKARNKIAAILEDESIQFLIPKSLNERFLFLFLAITAGFCEEIIFRGAMVYYLSNLSYDLSMVTIGIISSLLFGLVHLYQGWKGVLQVTYLGAILFAAFLITGNLWIAIALHFIIDVKFVFLPNFKHTDNNSNAFTQSKH